MADTASSPSAINWHALETFVDDEKDDVDVDEMHNWHEKLLDVSQLTSCRFAKFYLDKKRVISSIAQHGRRLAHAEADSYGPEGTQGGRSSCFHKIRNIKRDSLAREQLLLHRG